MQKLLTAMAAVLMLALQPAFAAEGTPAKKETSSKMEGMSKEMREKMALHHEKMAQCLRSEKTMKECHEEMHEQCKGEKGHDSCPMMGMKHHKGMMKGHKDMMKDHKEHDSESK